MAVCKANRVLYSCIIVLVGQIMFYEQIYAGEPVKANYKRGSALFQHPFYDTLIGKNQWKIRATIGGAKPTYLTQKVALYRAAELAKNNGLPYFRITFRETTQQNSTLHGSIGGWTRLTVEATDQVDSANHCEKEISLDCGTVNVEQTFVEMKPFLNFK